jgi:hypothetical protein
MANTLTALAPTLFSTARIVPNELTGFLGAVSRDFDDKGVSQGGTVKVSVVPRLTAGSIATPSMAFTAGSDRIGSSIDLTLNQTAEVSWNMTAEEERQLMNGGTAVDVFTQTVKQGWRSLRNQVEAYIGTLAKNSASRSVGTSGTTPFASNTDLLVDAQTILKDNGVQDELSFIMNTAASAKLQKLTNLQKISEAGNGDLLRAGILGNLHGFALRESAGVATHTVGSGTSYTSSTAGFAIGSTDIAIITGSGTVLAGDVVTFTGDTNEYVVKTGVAAAGTITLQEPGLKKALAASAVAMTIKTTAYAGNIALNKNAIVAVVRPSLQPDGANAEQLTVSDEVTGLSALFLRVPGDGMTSWYMRQVYAAAAVNPYGIASLRG